MNKNLGKYFLKVRSGKKKMQSGFGQFTSSLLLLVLVVFSIIGCTVQETNAEIELANFCDSGATSVSSCGSYVRVDLPNEIRFYPTSANDLSQISCERGDKEAVSAECAELVHFSCDKEVTCGKAVDEPSKEEVFCSDPRPEICTLEYNPVCGKIDSGIRCITEPCPSIEYETFSNGCNACSAGAISYTEGACDEKRPLWKYAICDDLPPAFEQIKDDYNCVESCPAGFDTFGTQIGLRVCIEHLGEEEFAKMPLCSTSLSCSEEESCILTNRATSGEEISDAEFRCAPQSYVEFMIHYSGATTKDEFGRESTAIA